MIEVDSDGLEVITVTASRHSNAGWWLLAGGLILWLLLRRK